MDIKHFLKDHAYQNIPLTFDEAYSLGVYALEGCRGNVLAQVQSIATLCALHTKATYCWQRERGREKSHGHTLPETSAEQIAGVCAAIFEYDIAISEYGFLWPNLPYAMDNCGMGGDLMVTANVSTLAAFIAAAAGIPMAKHGSPANADAGRHGSSDFITFCGINKDPTKKEVEQCLEDLSFGYTDALNIGYKRIHLQTHKVARIPHMNDIIGPITNPLEPKLLRYRVLGVNHLIPPRVVADAYRILNAKGITHIEQALIVRGFVSPRRDEGMDELSICQGGTLVAELKNGEISEYWLGAEDFGLQPVDYSTISPPKGISKGDFSFKILKGEIDGPALEMVLANAALLFYLAERSQSLRDCYEMARVVHQSGLAYEKMLEIRKRIPRPAH